MRNKFHLEFISRGGKLYLNLTDPLIFKKALRARTEIVAHLRHNRHLVLCDLSPKAITLRYTRLGR
jgi:hypothetical protein